MLTLKRYLCIQVPSTCIEITHHLIRLYHNNFYCKLGKKFTSRLQSISSSQDAFRTLMPTMNSRMPTSHCLSLFLTHPDFGATFIDN